MLDTMLDIILDMLDAVLAMGGPLALIISFYFLFTVNRQPKRKDCTKIKFKNFLQFFNISPESWELHRYYVIKRTKEEELLFIFSSIGRIQYRFYYTKLIIKSILEDLKELKEEIKQEKIKAKKETKVHHNQQTIKLLEAVQEEINAMKAQSVREIDESAKTMMEIQDRITN